MNLILRFPTEKNRIFVRRLSSEANARFNFPARVQGGGGLISVWGRGMMVAKGVDHWFFMMED